MCLPRPPVGELGSLDRFWAVKALDFVTALESVRACEDVLKLFGQEIAQVGFHSYIIVAVDKRDFSRRVMARSWHPQWAATYESENMTEADPVRRELWRALNPFLWSEVRYNRQRESRAKSIMHRATDFRMNEGLCVPIHHGRSPIAGINISGEKPDLGPGVKAALHIMSLFSYNRFRAVAKPTSCQSGNLLTKRECEVLQWVSAGKSDWDIGAILNISERTSRAHVTNAARKLNAANRAAAVAEAFRVGAISLNH